MYTKSIDYSLLTTLKPYKLIAPLVKFNLDDKKKFPHSPRAVDICVLIFIFIRFASDFLKAFVYTGSK